jgi:RNA polymerase sigma-70 factor (ECF subfamily)
MSLTDSELISAFNAGDAGAFESLISRHTDAIFAYLARLTGDREAAADLTQETFVKAWTHLGRFRIGENFKTWLFTIARNTCFDWLRKKKLVPFTALERDDEYSFAEGIADTEPLPDELARRAEDGRFLETLLAQVPIESREILLLHYVEGMTFDEIGKMRSESLNTVKSRHRRALIALRDKAGESAPHTRQ